MKRYSVFVLALIGLISLLGFSPIAAQGNGVLPVTSNVLAGDNNGGASDSGIAPANVVTLGGTPPSCAVGGSAGTGGACSVSGRDGTHSLSLTIGASGVSAGVGGTITFSTTRGHNTYCSWAPTSANAASSSGYFYLSGGSPTTYTINLASATVPAGTYTWNLTCP